MAVVRVGLFHEGAVTLVEVEHDKLSVKELAPEAVGEFIEMLKSFGTVLPEGTEEGYTAFIDFDRKRYNVRNECPLPELGAGLPAGWERYEANVVNPDPKKSKLGVYQLGDPPPPAPDAEAGGEGEKKETPDKPAKEPTGIGGEYVLKLIEYQKKQKGKLRGPH